MSILDSWTLAYIEEVQQKGDIIGSWTIARHPNHLLGEDKCIDAEKC